MARRKGSRSEDYEKRRRALAFSVFKCIMEQGHPSFNAMAEAAEVSRPTLRHYFTDREGAVRAALEVAAEAGEPHVRSLLLIPTEDPEACLKQILTATARGWQEFGVGRLHHVGLKTGLDDALTGQTYLTHILEPLQQALEEVLEGLIASGHFRPHCTRLGALNLLAPLTLALLHQDGLSGRTVRPLEIPSVISEVVEAYCRAYAVQS